MAARSSVPVDEVQAPPPTADWGTLGYHGSSYLGDAHFQNGVAHASMHAGADQITGVPVDVSSFVANIGMTSAGFEMSNGALAATGFDAAGGVPAEEAMYGQPQSGSNNKPPASLKASLKAPWTEEEDRILKEMVEHHGERKWSVIAQCLPGRIGKQCRERWINHLHPDIKQNDLWTEDDDRMLIDAHVNFGNRWSSIAKFLPGRSENAIKNHWNATLRSLKAKRRLKKKKSEQAPPGQFSILEEYIRSQYLEDAAMPAAPAAPPSPPRHHLEHGSGLLHPAARAPAAIPTNTEMSMSFHGGGNSAGSSSLGMINLNMPPSTLADPDLDLNLNNISAPQEYCLNYPNCMYAPAPVPQRGLAPTQDPPQTGSNLNLSQYASYIELLRAEDPGSRYNYAGASSSNPGANGYYNMPASDEVTPDFNMFK